LDSVKKTAMILGQGSCPKDENQQFLKVFHVKKNKSKLFWFSAY